MKAAVFHGRRDIRVENVLPPTGPLGSRKVLLKTLFAGICGTDLHEFASGPDIVPVKPHPLTGSQLPQILGHEFSAEVVDIGNDVSEAAIGDLVAVRPGIWCGRCPQCRSGLNTSCRDFAAVGLSHPWGGFAEFAVVDAEQLVVMPNGVTAQQAAMMEPLQVGVQAFRQTRINPGQRLLITGGGPIGALTALYAVAAGTGEVIISEPNPNRRELLNKLEGIVAIDPVADAAETVRLGVDACVEAAGREEALSLCIRAVRPGGVVVQTGLHGKSPTIDITSLNIKQVALIGTWCWPITGWDETALLIANGRLPIDRLITGVISIEQIVEQGMEALLDPRSDHQKILVHIGDQAAA